MFTIFLNIDSSNRVFLELPHKRPSFTDQRSKMMILLALKQVYSNNAVLKLGHDHNIISITNLPYCEMDHNKNLITAQLVGHRDIFVLDLVLVPNENPVFFKSSNYFHHHIVLLSFSVSVGLLG